MEKIPNFEKQETPRFKTIEHTVVEILPTGEKIEEVIECNGVTHRRCVDKVTYDAEGQIDFVEQLSREEGRECGGH